MKIFPRKYFFSPLLITLIGVFIFTPLYLSLTSKYKIKIIHSEQNTRNTYFEDLDFDGISEKIHYYGYTFSKDYKRTTVILRTQNNSIKEIWNHNGRFIMKSDPLFCDFDNDSLKEIFTFHRRADSIFLNGIRPDKANKFFIKDRLLDTTQFVNGTVDFAIRGVANADLNNDGFREIIFIINAGFSLQPRNLYAYDIVNDSLWKSPPSYAHLGGPLAIVSDVDKDSNPEFILHTHASNNVQDQNVPYPDNKSYLMVLNESLNLEFSPYELKSPLSSLHSIPIVFDNESFILGYFRSNKKETRDSLMLFKTDGEQVTSKCLHETTIKRLPFVYLGNKNQKPFDSPYLIFSNGMAIKYNKQLQEIKLIKLSLEKIYFYIPTKIKEGKANGFLLVSENEIGFANENLKIIAQKHIEGTRGLRQLSFIHRQENKRSYYFLQGTDWKYILDLHKNIWYTNAWLVILFFGLFLWLVVYLIKTIFILIREYNISKLLAEREKHKTHLARELHDELGSRITGLRLKIANLQHEKFQYELNELSGDLQKTHEEVKSIIYNLAPPNLAGKSFYVLMKQLVDNYKTLNQFEISLECIPGKNIFDDFDEHVQKELFRIVQEGLNNIAKHARASEVVVQFVRRDNILELYIDDNGIGFQAEQMLMNTNGQGIKSMEMRVKMLKGHFHIYSALNKGTGIAIQIRTKSHKNVRNSVFGFIGRRS